MLDENSISFRKMQMNDIPRMHQWLSQAHVHQWYDKDKPGSMDEITKRYGPKIRGEKPTDCYVVLYENKSVGYIQTYRVNDWPEYGNFVGYDDYTAGVDLFIGELSFMGKGLGSLILKKFLRKIVFVKKDITTCIIDPEPTNIRAIKAYEKAGFRYAKTIHIPGEPDPKRIMEMKKTIYRINPSPMTPTIMRYAATK